MNLPNKLVQQAIRIRAFLRRTFPPEKRWRRAAAAFGLIAFVFVAGVYLRYALLIQRHLGSGPPESYAMIFAAPRTIAAGERTSIEDVVAHLQRAGYGESQDRPLGWYRRTADGLEIHPGPASYFAQHSAVLRFSRGRLTRIVARPDNRLRDRLLLEPEAISSVSGPTREKRRPVRFADIPRHMVQAVVAVEDKRFFLHPGFDPFRTIKAAWVDVKQRRMEQGASTLSMQLARTLWLDQRKTFRRKLLELMIALELERRFSKQQIFEHYANHIYLGRRGSFSIHGFGEAARAYFGKDLWQITVPEAALMAAIIQRPSFYNPFRHPDRARERRDLVLSLMRDVKYITDEEYRAAAAAPIRLAPPEMQSADAPYFVDLVQAEHGSQRIYTTIDMPLQREAAEAVRVGLAEVDAYVRWRHKRRRNQPPIVLPQVALVALDPTTAEVKALVGGRDYAASQLNRALARRQPGSVFKPFVYAAALNAAAAGGAPITAASIVMDEPTIFRFGTESYQPANFGDAFYGPVTVREAFAKSLNVPAVKIAQQAGFAAVADLARRAGMNDGIRATPSVALGAYEVTPLEMAGAFTLFSNHGTAAKPWWISSIRDTRGEAVYTAAPDVATVLDPRVAYLVVSLMEEALNNGTGASVRARGFALPAAGKTGTSHDGWFAGFTSNLLCVVWVGFDDNRELGLEGARSALPIWTEFMKRAHRLRDYRDARPFPVPAGIVQASVDAETGKLANEFCPTVHSDVFIAGTEPNEACVEHTPHKLNVFRRIWDIFR